MRVYYHMDGNGIGSHITDLCLRGDIHDGAIFILKFSAAMQKISQLIMEHDEPDFLIVGGDDILSSFEMDLEFCEKIRAIFHDMTGNEISIGIGDSPVEADLALEFAKRVVSGISIYSESGYK